MAFFIIYVGGLLVLFSYFASLTGSRIFSFDFRVFLLSLLIIFAASSVHTPRFDISRILLTERAPLLLYRIVVLFYAIILVVGLVRPQAGPLRGICYACV